MEKKKITQKHHQNPLSLSSTSHNKQNDPIKKNFKISDRFILKSLIPIGTFYKTYKGIDLLTKKYVIIYLKPSSKQKMFSKTIKEEFRQKIAPALKWSGTQKIDKNMFDIEIHAKFGPSLCQIMQKYKQKINDKTFYLLAYHLLKLIDRIDMAGLVIRSLNLKNIVLSDNYHKNDLYLINAFDLERKNEQSFSSYDIRYCSIGTHLKLKTSSKDSVQSVCYVLMDFYKKGQLFYNVKYGTQKQYLQSKTTLKPQSIPITFLQFLQYIRNLSHNQQIKFTQWKIKFKKCVSQDDFHRPYQWVQAAKLKLSLSQSKSTINILTQPPSESISEEQENIFEEQENANKQLQQRETNNQLQEGDISLISKINEKMMKTSYCNAKRV